MAGAWAWLWTAVGAATRTDADVQARTVLAAALRTVRAEVSSAAEARLVPGVPTGRGLRLVSRIPFSVGDVTDIVWDPSRAVLWRRTSSTYVADGVTWFKVTLLDARGRQLDDGVRAAAIRIEIVVERAGSSTTASTCFAVGQP
jgi:hypothetical protein